MTTAWRFGEGVVALDDHGAPTAFVHDQLATNGFLLSQATDSWHTADRCWGAGFVITDHGATRWAVPDSSSVEAEVATQCFRLTDRLQLDVQRARRLPPRGPSAQAVDLAGRGGDIPAHEVSYEAASGSPAAAPPEQCGRRAYQELCRRHRRSRKC